MRGESRRASLALFACVLAAAACRRSNEAPAPARTDARADTALSAHAGGGDAAMPAVASASDDGDDEMTAAVRLNDLICKRPRCCVTRAMPAGVGRDGTRYTVVRVDLRPNRRRCPVPQTGDEQDVIDPAALAAAERGELDDKQRERYRWDFVEEKGGKVRWRQPLEIDRWALDDFGMGGGEDGMSADAAARTVTYSSENGSAWRGDETVTIGLDPLRVVEYSNHSWWRGGEDDDRVKWSWDTFSGNRSQSIGFCRTGPGPDAGFPAEGLDGDTGNSDDPVAATDEVILPSVGLPAAFVKTGWATTSFRACAAHVDGKDSGFTIHGPARGDSGDSALWAVVSGGVLFVEITDDRLVPAAKSWVKADHLELWRTSDSAGYGRGSGCFQANPDAKALQWGVGLDGRVYRAHGAPASDPTVRVTRTEGGARFRIVLPAEGKGLTVVYSDSDDGAQQKRLIATSLLRFGRTWTIGGITSIGASRATCVDTGGALRPKIPPPRRSPNLLFRDLPFELEGD